MISAPAVERREVRVGRLLAEGGEGRVYELPERPGVVLKAYRSPAPRASLDGLAAWPGVASSTRPDLVARVSSAAAWPLAVVVDQGKASGVLLPRAPERFSVRHRDGESRLGTLSYLTADPAQRSAAYGVNLPAALDPARFGIVYALARVIQAMQEADPRLGHGDLSAKNVLWSLARGPEVFLLDCDNCEIFAADGVARRPRASTSNWDDPAVPANASPDLASDRYSLALIFLRVVGAAHFPVQARQRKGEPVQLEFEIPASLRRVGPLRHDGPIWGVCERSLSIADPAGRPSAADWVAALEQVLDGMGAMSVVRAVWATQGGGSPAPTPAALNGAKVPDVTVRPVAALARRRNWQRVVAAAPPPPVAPLAASRPRAPRAAAPATRAVPVRAQLRAYLDSAVSWWLFQHRRMWSALTSPGRRGLGARQLAFCVVADFVLASTLLFLIAMMVSPFLGI